MTSFEKLLSPKSRSAGVYEYRINIKQHSIVVRKTYPIPFAYCDRVDSQIQQVLENGIIQPSMSPYCNPMSIIIKKNRNIRIYLDARFINEIIKADHESPPLINELMQKFYDVSYMPMTDLANACWQIPLHRDSRQYTAFLHGSRMYQFCRIPFEIKTAGSAFVRALNLAIGNKFNDFLTIYIDDLLIATSGNFNNYINKISEVFEVSQSQNFTLNLAKSIYCKRSVKFFGYKLSTEGILPPLYRLEIIRNFPIPESRLNLQQFLGLCTYYRQFSIRHSNYVDPFRGLLKKSNPWIWTLEHTLAFDELKRNFASCTMLKHIIPDAPFRLQTDASNCGIAEILYQVDKEEDHRVVSLVSRCLNWAELNYTTTEKELLAIISSITKLRTFLIGRRFTIITDHKGLTFLNNTLYLNSRLIQWSIVLQQCDYDVRYCAGRDNIVADLCREFKKLGNFQMNDSYLKPIIGDIESERYRNHYLMYRGILFHRDSDGSSCKTVVPEELQLRLIDHVHTKLGHPGVYKTSMYLKDLYYWSSMNG